MNEATGSVTTAKQNYSPEMFYNFGRQQLKNKDIGQKLGTSTIRVSQILRLAPELREAFKKGKAGIDLSDDLTLSSVLQKDVPAGERISADQADQRAVKAVKTALAMKLFFLKDIAAHTGIDNLTVYKTLAELVAAGEVIKDDAQEPHSFRLATGADKMQAAETAAEKPVKKSSSEISGKGKSEETKEVEAKILAAIDELYCTLPQIKRHAGFERDFDISDYLEEMLADETIIKQTNGVADSGTFTAYFRFLNPPKRFWLSGGKCAVEMPSDEEKKVLQPRKHSELIGRDTDDAKAELIVNPKKIIAEAAAQPAALKPDDPAQSNNFLFSKTEAKPAKSEAVAVKVEPKKEKAPEMPSPTKEKRTYASKKSGLTPESIKKMAAEGCTQGRIAKNLNVSRITVETWLRNDPALKSAYFEGREEFSSRKADEQTTGVSPQKARKNIDWTPELIEQLASEHYSLKKAAKSFGVAISTIGYQLSKTPENKAAWERGQKAFKNSQTKQPVEIAEAPSPVPAEDLKIAQDFCDAQPQMTEDPNVVEKFVEFREKARETTLTDVLVHAAKNGIDYSGDTEKFQHFANCSGCDKPFNGFPKHIGREETFCDNCAAKLQELSEDEREKVESVFNQVPESVKTEEKQNLLGALQKPFFFRELTLENDGLFFVQIEGNFFDLPSGTRRVLNQIRDLIEVLEKPNEPKTV